MRTEKQIQKCKIDEFRDCINHPGDAVFFADAYASDYQELLDAASAETMNICPISGSGTLYLRYKTEEVNDATIKHLMPVCYYDVGVLRYACEPEGDLLLFHLSISSFSYNAILSNPSTEEIVSLLQKNLTEDSGYRDHVLTIDLSTGEPIRSANKPETPRALAMISFMWEEQFDITVPEYLAFPDFLNSFLSNSLRNYVDPVVWVYDHQHRQADITHYLDELADSSTPEYADKWVDMYDAYSDLLSFFGTINYLLAHPELKKVEKRKPAATQNEKHTAAPKQPADRSVRRISINSLQIVTARPKVAKALTTRAYTRSAECWNVRGHYRTLKSGKQIYIKPYKKGSGRNTTTTIYHF